MAKPTIIISQQDLQRLETMLDHQAKLSPTMQHLEDDAVGNVDRVINRANEILVFHRPIEGFFTRIAGIPA